MDGYSFIVGIVRALAWPVAVVVIALLFRKQLIGLLASVKRGKFAGAEVEFERGVRAIEVPMSAPPSASSRESAIKEAAFNPRAAVLEAWLKLEDQVIEVAFQRGLVNPSAHRWPQGAMAAVKKSGLLPPVSLNLLDKLRELRNWAVHYSEFSPDPSTVVTYMQAAAVLGKELQTLASSKP